LITGSGSVNCVGGKSLPDVAARGASSATTSRVRVLVLWKVAAYRRGAGTNRLSVVKKRQAQDVIWKGGEILLTERPKGNQAGEKR